MKMSLLRQRYSVAAISFILLSSLIGKPVLALPGDSASTASRARAAASISVSASAAGVLTCTNPSTTLTASTTASGGTTFIWSGPNFFSALGSSVTVSTAGIYTVTATNSAGTGTATVTVTANTAAPTGVTASNNGPLTCNITSATLTGSTTTPGASLVWTGTGNVASFRATGSSAIVTAPGTYTLTATNPSTGCTTTALTTVIQTLTVPTGVTASHLGELTCSNNIVYLSASSTTTPAPEVSYAWTGPGGFTATGASTTASTAGIYTVTATYIPTGCTASANATVSRIFTAPGNVTATASGSLNCTNSSVTLTGSSSTSGADYTWAGPNGFTASGTSVTTSTPGTYTLTADDGSTAFGCTAATTVTVTIDTATPTAPSTNSVPANAVLTCSSPNVVLTGSSGTSGVNYLWTGPNGFSVAQAVATATTPGSYVLTVTNPSNGCSSTVTATTVTQNVVLPVGVTANASNKITCTTTTTTLTGNSTTTGATYTWTGPGGFTSAAPIATASLGGIYTLTATNSANGCTTSKSITVVADTATPTGVTATNSGPLNCNVTTVTLTGNSATTGVSYIWTGPNGYFDPEQVSAMATDSGTYILTVTNGENGCTSTASTYVAQDLTACTAVRSQVTAGKASGFGGSAADFVYKVYPNPVGNTTGAIEFKAPVAAEVIVGIYNNTGVLERVLFSNVVEAGQSYRLTLDRGRLAAGVHYCMIRVNGEVYTSKVVILP